ncbi:apolipoprotein e [Anaeramoeba ignava]|uniref:Apolipoprotein e n=1 Tax=Anaeramoeba ignava TaxID=1746090 RepID=A0A9Q0R7W3_ANAIG|nr:apolipoprotein e [Anaeramoeba ignava]
MGNFVDLSLKMNFSKSQPKINLKKYRKLIQNTTESIVAFSSQGKLTEINEQAIDMFSSASKQSCINQEPEFFCFLNQKHVNLEVKVYLQKQIQALLALDNQQQVDFDLHCKTSTNKSLWVHCWLTPINCQPFLVQAILRPTSEPQPKLEPISDFNQNLSDVSETIEDNFQNQNTNQNLRSKSFISTSEDVLSSDQLFNLNNLQENEDFDNAIDLITESIDQFRLEKKILKQKHEDKKEKTRNDLQSQIDTLSENLQEINQKIKEKEQDSQLRNKELRQSQKLILQSEDSNQQIQKLKTEIEQIQKIHKKQKQQLKQKFEEKIQKIEQEKKINDEKIKQLLQKLHQVEKEKEDLEKLV